MKDKYEDVISMQKNELLKEQLRIKTIEDEINRKENDIKKKMES